MNPAFNNPFEEERHSRVIQPIQAMLKVLGIVGEELREAMRRPTIRESTQRYDAALDLLFNLMTLAKPLAFRQEANGRRMFLWIEDGGSPRATFHWLVCNPSGSWKQGVESSQEICERVAESLLRAPRDSA
jgi:hypothetical protein